MFSGKCIFIINFIYRNQSVCKVKDDITDSLPKSTKYLLFQINIFFPVSLVVLEVHGLWANKASEHWNTGSVEGHIKVSSSFYFYLEFSPVVFLKLLWFSYLAKLKTYYNKDWSILKAKYCKICCKILMQCSFVSEKFSTNVKLSEWYHKTPKFKKVFNLIFS